MSGPQLSDKTVTPMTPVLVGLGCDDRFLAEVRESIVESAQQLEKSVNVGLRL
jgi:hypothetical protein